MLERRFIIALLLAVPLCALVVALARTSAIPPLVLTVRDYRVGSPIMSNYLGMQFGSECIHAIIEGSNTTSQSLLCRVYLSGLRSSDGRFQAAPSRCYTSDSIGGWRERPRTRGYP